KCFMGQFFPYAFENKRYHTWNYHLKNKFGQKIFKVAIDGGFDCPNRDGTVAHGGCTFCSAAGSGDFAGNRVDPIDVQFQQIKDRMHEKWSDGQYIAYFQAFTNSHAPVEELREKYETALREPGVVGLSIGTRPDCVPDDVVEYLAELNERTYLCVELGLKTVHRIKIHLLHLLKGTPMVKQYDKGMLEFMSQDEYTHLVCDQLEIIPKEMIVHRITGDGPIDLMVGPMWSVNKWEVLNEIDNELGRRESYQGKHFESTVKT